MRKLLGTFLALILVATLAGPVPSFGKISAPRRSNSPPGQLMLISLNADQTRVVNKQRFDRLFEAVRAWRFRPLQFDGGVNGGVAAPDIVMLQEARFSNAEVFRLLLRQRFNNRYQEMGGDHAWGKIIANIDTVTPVGEPVPWADVCFPATEDHPGRVYEYHRFIDNATGDPFTIVSVHFSRRYSQTGETECLKRNIEKMKDLLADEPGAIFVGGDFNQRPRQVDLECDPQERADPAPWFSVMIDNEIGRSFVDSVHAYQRRSGGSMRTQWTFERSQPAILCNGKEMLKRTRLDYIFSSGATVAEASADHPGWSGGKRGSRSKTNPYYSDHRFVWGRYVLSGPPRPPRPQVVPASQGRMMVSWEPSEVALGGWYVYRSRGRRDFNLHAKLPTHASHFEDVFTQHGRRYRYAVAAVGADGGQGYESRPTWGTADARGPRVSYHSPARRARGVRPGARIEVKVDERFNDKKWGQNSVRLVLNGNRVGGSVRRGGPRLLIFRPNRPLKRGREYRVRVMGLRDRLGNLGPSYSWRFRTVPRR